MNFFLLEYGKNASEKMLVEEEEAIYKFMQILPLDAALLGDTQENGMENCCSLREQKSV